MNKYDIVALVLEKVEDISDLDERLFRALELLEEYKDHEDFSEIMNTVYFKIRDEITQEEDPRLVEFANVLESTNELIMNEQYEEVITLLTPFQDLVDELLDVSNIEFDKPPTSIANSFGLSNGSLNECDTNNAKLVFLEPNFGSL